jgi:membrane protein
VSPEILPPRPKVGVRTIAARFLDALWKYDILSLAAGLAFYLLFSLFPLALIFLTLLAFLPIPNLDEALIDLLRRVAPPELITLLKTQILDVVNRQRTGLLSAGFVLAVWSASAATGSAMASLDRGYEVEESRPWWKLRLQAIALTIALAILVIGSLVLVAWGPQLGERLASAIGLGGVFATAWNVVRWPVVLVAVSFGAAILYYYGPDVEQDFRWITPGSVFATALWVGVSLGFAYYVRSFGNFNQTYGTLGAVMILMLWLYLSAFCFLAGGLLNAVVEHLHPNGKAPGAKRLADKGLAPRSPEAKAFEEREREHGRPTASEAVRREERRERRSEPPGAAGR